MEVVLPTQNEWKRMEMAEAASGSDVLADDSPYLKVRLAGWLASWLCSFCLKLTKSDGSIAGDAEVHSASGRRR